MITFTRCAFVAKQACATFSQVVQKITPPIANNFLKFFFALFATLTLNAATAWGADPKVGDVIFLEEFTVTSKTMANAYDFAGTTTWSGSTSGLSYASSSTSSYMETQTANPITSANFFFVKASESNLTMSGILIPSNTIAVTVSFQSNKTIVKCTYSFDGTNFSTGATSKSGVQTFDIDCTGKSKLYFKFSKTGTTSNARIDNVTVKVKTISSPSATLVDPAVTFSNGSYTVGGSVLDLSTLWTSDSDGAVTYSIVEAGTTGASINGTSFTATAAGTCIVKASQAATSAYNAITKTATITVTAPTPANPYKVTLEAGPGTCVESVTEASAGAGVTLPTPTLDCGNWEFAGWTTSSVATETTSKPEILLTGTYSPSTDITLYAVYKRIETTEGAGTTEVTKIVSISDYASAKSWNNDNRYTTVNIDANITATASSDPATNTGKYYSNDNSWRFYQNETGKLTITANEGITLKSITLTFTNKDYGTISYNSNSCTSNKAISVSGQSATFTVGSSSGSKGKILITKISVTYTTSGGSSTTTYYHSTPECAAPCTDPGLAYAIASVTKTVGDAAFTNPLTNNKNVSVTYTSTNTDVATVDNNGQVKIKAVGETKIKATWAGNADYCADEASYTLTVLPKTYTITVANNISNGSVSADKSSAVEGATIKLTATPNTGYKLGTWNVKDASNNPVSVNVSGEFTMPASDVTVSATFVSLPKLATPSELSATEIKPTSATLNWKWLENTYTTQLNCYYLYIMKEGDANFTGTITCTSTSCSRTDLEPNTKYIWKVQAISKDTKTVLNGEESAESSFTTEALPTYTVSFSTGTGNPTQADIKETEGGAGIKLPAGPDPLCPDWTFAGWAEAEVTEPTTEPTLFAEGTNYKPTGDCTLYAVYSKTEENGGVGTTTFDFDVIAIEEGWIGGKNGYSDITIGSVSIHVDKGTSDYNGRWWADNTWRIYKGNKVTITSAKQDVTAVSTTPSTTFAISDGEATLSPTSRVDFTEIIVTTSSSGSSTIYNSNPTCTQEPDVELQSIEISGDLTKKTYIVGDVLDLSGLSVIAKYSDGTSQNVTTEVEWSDVTLTVGQTSVTLIATYEGKTDDITITGLTVSSPATPEPEGEWVLTPLADITCSDLVVITMKNSNGTYALTNGNGTSDAPKATEVEIANDKLKTEPSEILQWVVMNNNGGLTIYPVNDYNSWLYCKDDNNDGVRVGDKENAVFTIDATSGYLYHLKTARYLGVYNNSEWRCYTTVNNNIKEQTLAFFVKKDANPNPCEKPVDDGINPVATFIFNTAEGLEKLGITDVESSLNISEGREFIQKGVTMTNVTNGSTSTRVWLTTSGNYDLRMYKKAVFKLSVPQGHNIRKVVFEGDNINYLTADNGRLDQKVWTGKQQEVVFTIADDAATVKIYTISVAVDYTRDVTPGEYGTICIPYGSNNYTGAEFYEVSWLKEGLGLYLDELAANAELVAGKPYIFLATSDEIEIICTGEAVINPVDGKAGLTGTFTKIQDLQTSDPSNTLEGNYMIADNKIWLCGTSCWLNANRAYIKDSKLPKTEQAKIPGRRRVCMGENAATGLDNITNGENNTIKVIENGQLFIIRNGEKYNIQGQKL